MNLQTPPRVLQPHELGWIAGLIDLKGIIIIKQNALRATPQSVLMVESKALEVIQRISGYTGTDPDHKTHSKIKEEWRRRGCSEHCPDQHIHVQEVNMPVTARWQVTGSSLVVVLYNVLPYLTESPKLLKFREGMELVASHVALSGQGRPAIDRAIKRLSGLGWVIPPYLFRDDEEQEVLEIS